MVIYVNYVRVQVQVRRVDNEAATQWTTSIGEAGAGKFSVGYSVIEVDIDIRLRMMNDHLAGPQCPLCGARAVAD